MNDLTNKIITSPFQYNYNFNKNKYNNDQIIFLKDSQSMPSLYDIKNKNILEQIEKMQENYNTQSLEIKETNDGVI